MEVEVEIVDHPRLAVVLGQTPGDNRRSRLGGHCLYLRPKRRKTQARAAKVSTMRPIPTRPPNAEGETVLRTSMSAVASAVVARNPI